MSDMQNEPENEEVKLEWAPEYSIEHVRTSLKSSEPHPCQVFAADVFKHLPVEFLRALADKLAEQLKEQEDHPMGVVWETLRKILNNEKVADRYLMGAALYTANNVMQLGPMCQHMFMQQVEASNEPAHKGDGNDPVDPETVGEIEDE